MVGMTSAVGVTTLRGSRAQAQARVAQQLTILKTQLQVGLTFFLSVCVSFSLFLSFDGNMHLCLIRCLIHFVIFHKIFSILYWF